MTFNFAAFPPEMKAVRSWVMWRYVLKPGMSKPTKIPFHPNGHAASTTEPASWVSFAEAEAAYRGGAGGFDGVGFVFNGDFIGIDLDDPWHGLDPSNPHHVATHEERLELYRRILDRFQTYSEWSPSMKGVHIICRGSVESGKRKNGVEMYSSGRFFTMTGNTFDPNKTKIEDCAGYVDILWRQLAGDKDGKSLLRVESKPETRDDNTILTELWHSKGSGELFQALWVGDKSHYNNDHSAADQAICNMIGTRTDNLEQVERIWGLSELAKRPKWNRKDYRRMTLEKCFDMKYDIEAGKRYADNVAAALKATVPAPVSPMPATVAVIDPENPQPYTVSAFTRPPGLVGEIADFFYSHAPFPVPEIALVGAIGMFAGIVGRQFNISGTGLNQYIILVAKSGRGKDAIKTGIATLVNAVAGGPPPDTKDGDRDLNMAPSIRDFIGPGGVASSPALMKEFNKRSSFVWYVPEFGHWLKGMVGDRAPAHLSTLRGTILDFYTNSGQGQVVGAQVYSKAENNTKALYSPALTIIGEGTPDVFYSVVDHSLIAEGLLPRFLTVEYEGLRCEENEARLMVPPAELVRKLQNLTAHVHMMAHGSKKPPLRAPNFVQDVFQEPDAKAFFRDFGHFATAQINAADREAVIQLWNRSKLKAMKLAALIAVGVSWYEPTVTLELAQWAKGIVVADIDAMLRRFERGDFGAAHEDSKQLNEVKRVVLEYLKGDRQQAIKYGSTPKLHAAAIIPMSYVNKRLVSLAAFRGHKLGASEGIKRTLLTLIDLGWLREYNRAALLNEFDFSGRGVVLCDPGDVL